MTCLLGSIVVLATATNARAGGEGHSDWEVAQDGSALHTLLILGDPKILGGEERIELLPGEGNFDGLFVNQEPGWESIEADEPPDAFMLLPGSNPSLKRISFDAGFGMYDPFSGLPILESNGSTFAFGAAPDGHFHLDLIYAGNGPIGTLYSATFQLVDPSGLQSDSAPFTLGFVVIPEPTTLALVFLGVTAKMRRTRRQSRRSFGISRSINRSGLRSAGALPRSAGGGLRLSSSALITDNTAQSPHAMNISTLQSKRPTPAPWVSA